MPRPLGLEARPLQPSQPSQPLQSLQPLQLHSASAVPAPQGGESVPWHRLPALVVPWSFACAVRCVRVAWIQTWGSPGDV
jgi:hypothetical protein